VARITGDASAPRLRRALVAGRMLRAVTAEMHHRRLELAELAEQIERLHRPPGHELEAIPVPAALELRLDRARLSVERTRIGAEWICGQEQYRVLVHP
jgi:hypothetical protein